MVKTFEVKFDEMADYTGNIAIEYESRGKPSGISITKAIYWVQYYGNKFHIMLVEDLKKELPDITWKDVVGGDVGSNTKIHLIKKDKFKDECDIII